MRLLHQNRERTTHAPDCHVCTGSGRVPYVDNHFDLWMLPCPACRRG